MLWLTCKEDTMAEKTSYAWAAELLDSGRKGVRMKWRPNSGMSIRVARTAFLLWAIEQWEVECRIEAALCIVPCLVGIGGVDCLQFGDQHSHNVDEKEYV